MNFAELIPLTAAICNALVTAFVFSRNPRSVLNRVYLIWGLSISVWNFGTFFMFRVRTKEEADIWAHVLQFGVIFIPVTLIHLSLLIAQMRTGILIRLLYVFHILLALSNFTTFFIRGARPFGYGAFYSVAGPGFWLFTLSYTLTMVSIFILVRKRKTLPPLQRTRLTYLIIAQATLVTFGSNDILPILNIDYYPFTTVQIFPVGSAAAIFYGAVVGYGVLHHQLLDAHLALTQLAAQLIRMAFVGLVGLVLLLLVSWLGPGQSGFTYYSFFASLGVLLVTALLVSIAFPRFFGKGEEALERKILGDRFGYHEQIRKFIQAMQSQPSANQVLPELRNLLVNTIRLQNFEVILLDETTRGFSLVASHPERLVAPVPGLHAQAPLFRFFRISGANYLACNILYAMPGETEVENAARQQIAEFKPEFCFSFFWEGEPMGFLLLGPKINEDPYTPEDVRLLTEMVQTLSLVFNQVRLKTQILMSQEQELLGRMSRGLAHDLNNLLTPVQTFLQLNAQELLDEESRAELLPVASRNIETVRAYVNEALFFSRTHALEVKQRRLDETVRNAVELMQPRARDKDIEVNIQGLSAFYAEMDEVMIQRMLSNLISNAIDASPRGGSLKIQLIRLPRTETAREWIRIKVIDGGEGISAENLQRIFTPYFTTKNRGDGKRGFGLGLAIARKIVHLHGGNLTVNSIETKGTTVQVDLPSRHTFNPARNPELKDATYDAIYK